jgi:hypothetical protein
MKLKSFGNRRYRRFTLRWFGGHAVYDGAAFAAGRRSPRPDFPE